MKAKIFILALVLLLVAMVVERLELGRTDRHGFPSAVKMQEATLLQALDSYRSTYGRYPSGSSIEILSILMGNNPMKIHFLTIGASNTNNAGEYIDPWQTPYQLTFESTNQVIIRSAGKNKIFSDTDDVEISDPPK